MLGLMRRHSRSIVIKLVYVGLILSFVIWGFGSYEGRQRLVAVDVNGESISFQEYQRAYENLLNIYKEQMGDRFNEEMIVQLNLKKQALDSLIERVLIIEEAKRQKIKASKEEISARIQAYPAFQNKGRFDNEVYFRVLSYSRLKPRDFENEQKDLILMEKVGRSIKSSAVVSDEEALQEYRADKTKVNLDYIKVPASKLEAGITTTNKELKDYFASHVGEFMIPEKINVGYVRFEPKAFLKEITLTNEDYEDYYKSYQDDFTIPREVRASHILIKFGEKKEEAEAKAAKLLEEVKGGADFAALAKEHSDDTASAKKGGDLGFFRSGAMVKPFEDAAFAMGKGEVSDLVESVYGYHIIKVVDIREESVKPLDHVKGEIDQILKAEISAEVAEGRAEDIYYEAIKGENLEALVMEEKLPYKESGLFSMDEISAELLDLREYVQTAATMAPGWVSRPIELEGSYYIISLIGKEEPREPKFEEVSEEVRAVVVREKAIKAAEELGQKLLAEAKKGKSFKALAGEADLKVEETGLFNRMNNFVPNVGVSQEMVARAFGLTEEAPLADSISRIGQSVILFRLKERREIKMEDFEKEKEAYRNRLLDQRREEVYRKWLDEARNKANVSYHEDLEEMRS